jgi:hypothetical protein
MLRQPRLPLPCTRAPRRFRERAIFGTDELIDSEVQEQNTFGRLFAPFNSLHSDLSRALHVK